jgi:hypothetical protein
MAKHVFVVMTNATGNRDAEFNKWYDNQHIPDVLRVPGFVAAQRFKISDAQLGDAKSQWKYLALYELETDNPAASLKELQARLGTPAMVMSETLDMSNLGAFMFTAIGDRVTAKK